MAQGPLLITFMTVLYSYIGHRYRGKSGRHVICPVEWEPMPCQMQREAAELITGI